MLHDQTVAAMDKLVQVVGEGLTSSRCGKAAGTKRQNSCANPTHACPRDGSAASK